MPKLEDTSFLALVAFLAGCESTQLPTEKAAVDNSPTVLGKGTQTGSCSWEYNLTAGQTIHVGIITVTNDATNLYVTYKLTEPCWTFGTLLLWVGNDLTNVPVNSQGTPVPGQFPHQVDASGLTEYTFAIPFDGLGITDVTQYCNTLLYFYAHAEVNCDQTGAHETAWGGNVAVTYNMSGGYTMEEVHIYAGDSKPTTAAPGQYGYTAYFDPRESGHTASFSVSDGNGDGIWIIAHAVVCGAF